MFKTCGIFVTLEEFAGFLYIKAMQRIEKFWGSCYGKRPFGSSDDLETKPSAQFNVLL